MTTPPNSPTVTEFVRFRVKPSVKPEEGEQSREGEQLLDLFRETILQSGHLGSAWGRTVEDENVLVWVIGMSLNVYLDDSRQGSHDFFLSTYLHS